MWDSSAKLRDPNPVSFGLRSRFLSVGCADSKGPSHAVTDDELGLLEGLVSGGNAHPDMPILGGVRSKPSILTALKLTCYGLRM